MTLEAVYDTTPRPRHGGNTPGWRERREARLKAEAEAAASELIPGAPRLDNAACVGLWVTFDPPRPRESRKSLQNRWRTAQALCADCPVLAQCRDWFDGLPEEHRPGGVVAGVVRSPYPGRRPKGRSAA